MDQVEKQRIMALLRKVSLWDEASEFREQSRVRHREAGEEREEATNAAWDEMWIVYQPICERLESGTPAEPELKNPQLAGLPDDLDSVLDSDYRETDPGRQLRDGLLWTALEWSRVIRDTPDGPVADLNAASNPPPNSWALMVLSTYALSGVDKRRDLISRAMSFAAKGQDKPVDGDSSDEEEAEGGYLDTIDL